MTAYECIRSIVERYIYRQSLRNPYLDELGDLWLPGIIRAPSGREIIFDFLMIEQIEKLASHLERDDRSIGYREWLDLIRQCVAYSLDETDSISSTNERSESIYNNISFMIKQHQNEIGEFEFVFGCTLFEGYFLSSFIIGPVRFESRVDWIKRKFSEGSISNSTQNRLIQSLDGKSPHKREHTRHNDLEETIMHLCADAPFVCSVRTNGLTYGFGRNTAKSIARLAMTSIASLSNNTSQALGRMNLVEDRIVRILPELTFRNGHISTWGSRKSHSPGGLRLSADSWSIIQKERIQYFNLVGELLNNIVDTTTPPHGKRTHHALTHSLLWIEQGCRADLPITAVINFASALDCLSGGENKKEITKLINSCMDDDAITHFIDLEKLSIDEAVNEIYDHARNATIHGRQYSRSGKPDSKPFHDWELTRQRAEYFAVLCFRSCTEWTENHPGCDDIEAWRSK